MKTRAWTAGATLLLLTGGLVSAPALAERKVPMGGDEKAEREDYRIGPEDVLQISVWKNEAMSLTVPVRPDGMISLPLLNDVPAAGRTPMELKDLLTKRLSEYMPGPEVSVIVREVRGPKVSVVGEVAHPGRYELKSRTTVLDLLAQAGGFTAFAARSRIVILRAVDKRLERIPFNYNKAFSDGVAQNIELHSGDIVLVP
jgi:polysaccharide export outer membrane protein